MKVRKIAYIFNFLRLRHICSQVSRLIRVFSSTILKNLAFIISKTNFIMYNTSFYNISSIKTSIFFNIPFKYSFFIIFYFSSLPPLSLSFSSQLFSAPPATASTHPYHNYHIHTPSLPLATSNRTKSPPTTTRKKGKKTHKPWPNRTTTHNQKKPTNQINQIGPRLLRSTLRPVLHG